MRHQIAFAHLCKSKNLVIFIFLLLFSLENIYSQDSTKPVYVALAYIKIKPGKAEAYRDLVKNYTKKVFQSQIKDGIIIGWRLNQVLMPSGTNEEYDYLGVTITTNLKSQLDPDMTFLQIMKKVFPEFDGKKLEGISRQYDDARSIVKREIYSNYTMAVPPSGSPAKYSWVTYQQPKPGKLAESEKWEKDNWTAIHKAAIELGGMKNWGVYTLELPYNADNKYSYLTANFFDDLSQYEGEFKYADAIKKAWPNMDFTKIFQLPGGDKTAYKSILLKLVEYVSSNTK